MKISIITVFPHLHEPFIQTSLVARAVELGTISFNLVALSNFCAPKERIDEPVVGPGVGMVLKPVVLERAIEHCQALYGPGYTIFFSPQGTILNQRVVQECYNRICHAVVDAGVDAEHDLSNEASTTEPHLIVVCPRYEGVDERVEHYYADMVISVGDFVLMGGDLPAQLFLESLLRLVPGVVGKHESVADDSFQGACFDFPTYGLPVEWKGMLIPSIVQSGNHRKIEEWRKDQALRKTVLNRFDWFSRSHVSADDCAAAWRHIPSHYVAIMHTNVLLKNGTVGETSIPSLDIHDIARASTTYGIKKFFIVSPLADQQDIVARFLDFWKSAEGRKYNESRYEAISHVESVYTFDELIRSIEEREGLRPLIVATSAVSQEHLQVIDYSCQSLLWKQERPILFLFGTGQGLSPAILKQADYLLAPVMGMTDYNHLSVRSAVSIILDRWLGLSPRSGEK